MKIETLSVFPHCYDSIMNESIMKRAQDKGFLDFYAYDLRDWTHDKHRTTDDEPYGGGQGLVMKCEPIFEATDDIFARYETKPYVIFLSPTGTPRKTISFSFAATTKVLTSAPIRWQMRCSLLVTTS